MLRLSDLFHAHSSTLSAQSSNPAALRAVEALPLLPQPPQGPNLLLLCPCEIAR